MLTVFIYAKLWRRSNVLTDLLVYEKIYVGTAAAFLRFFFFEIIPFIAEDSEKNIQVEREEVGIKLKVKPKVNRDGFITTKIEPEVSSVLELVGGYVPRTKVRKITTTVTVPDGQKIIIGGLLNSNIVKTVNKVPILGSIPILGYLFQHHVTNINTTDLIIEITPRVVTFDDYNVEYEIDERLEKRLLKEKVPEEKQEKVPEEIQE